MIAVGRTVRAPRDVRVDGKVYAPAGTIGEVVGVRERHSSEAEWMTHFRVQFLGTPEPVWCAGDEVEPS